MVNSDRPAVGSTEQGYEELEAELMRAVSDFGHEELNQLIDAAEAIRRTRRV